MFSLKTICSIFTSVRSRLRSLLYGMSCVWRSNSFTDCGRLDWIGLDLMRLIQMVSTGGAVPKAHGIGVRVSFSYFTNNSGRLDEQLV